MNRVIIIGNGFDKAHGLATGYRDFIDSYWIIFHIIYSMVTNVGLRNNTGGLMILLRMKMNLFYSRCSETNNIKHRSHHTLNLI